MEFNWLLVKHPLLSWYKKHHRDLPWRKTKDPYCIWLSEIMLQQTRVEAVKGYYEHFLSELPDIEALSKVSDDRLLKLWEGLGYYNRARNLKKAAIQIMEEYNGIFPAEYEEVLSLCGVGEYTAGAICSICFDKDTPAVDGNVLRVVMRILDCYDNIDDLKTKRQVKKWLTKLYSEGDCGDLTQALMELGATVCIPNGMPNCKECPLHTICLACKKKTYDRLPVRKEKKKRRIEEMTVFVLHDGDEYAIRKRDNKGLLAGLWEFYHMDRKMTRQQAMDFISEQGFCPLHIEREVPYTHVFSHVEWKMTAYYISCCNKKKDLTWIHRKEFDESYALPTAFRFFLEKEE
ncbi:MAG: A/G-specific adenine glycosylase [Lachnospiraceae bacterium]|nr:A/G-specific adenine glycosylase [Lachnospiraceae bacterium]